MEHIKEIMAKQHSATQSQSLQPSAACSSGLLTAIKSQTIATCSNDILLENLKYAMFSIGLRQQNMPTQIEFDFLKDFIRKNFGGNRVDEIKLAFDMAIADKLNIDLSEVNCYENFTCLYFSKIMTAYRNWAKEQIKYIPAVYPPIALPMAKQTPGEFVEFWQKEWNESKTKNYFLFSQFTKVYDILVNEKKIDLTDDEKLKIKSKAKQDLIDTCRNEYELAKMKIKVANSIFLEPHCKKLAVANHFSKLIEIDRF